MDYEVSTGRTSIMEETGLSFNLNKGSSIPFSMIDGELGSQSPSAAYTKSSKTRKSFLGEQQSLINGSHLAHRGAVGGPFPSIYT